MINAYGTAENFLTIFPMGNTPALPLCFNEKRKAYTATEEKRMRCVTGTAPTLAVMANGYGKDMADAWITGFLGTLYEACNQRLNPVQLDMVAGSVMDEFSHLKVTDFYLFATYVLSGRYGDFYGSDKVVSIGVALHKYEADRLAISAKAKKMAERAEAERMKSEIAQGMSLTEYLATLRTEQKGLRPSQKTFLTRYFATTQEERDAIRYTRTMRGPRAKMRKKARQRGKKATMSHKGGKVMA